MQAKMIVLAAATEGQREELDHWYGTRHIPDLLAVPGLTLAERYDLKLIKAPEGSPAWDYLSIYTLEGDDVMDVLKEMGSRMGGPSMPGSPALDSSKTLSYLAIPKAGEA